MNLAIFFKNTDLACYYMMVTPFRDKTYEKNMENLQTNIYLAFFSDFEYLVPSQSYKISIRISSKKTYCSDLLELEWTLYEYYSICIMQYICKMD